MQSTGGPGLWRLSNGNFPSSLSSPWGKLQVPRLPTPTYLARWSQRRPREGGRSRECRLGGVQSADLALLLLASLTAHLPPPLTCSSTLRSFLWVVFQAVPGQVGGRVAPALPCPEVRGRGWSPGKLPPFLGHCMFPGAWPNSTPPWAPQARGGAAGYHAW